MAAAVKPLGEEPADLDADVGGPEAGAPLVRPALLRRRPREDATRGEVRAVLKGLEGDAQSEAEVLDGRLEFGRAD